MRLVLVWLINTLALLAIPYVIPGVKVDTFTAALIAALVLGLINTLIRPILILLTLGLFIFVINGLLFWWVGSFLDGFHVSGFWAGFFGAIVYSIVSWVLSSLLPRKQG